MRNRHYFKIILFVIIAFVSFNVLANDEQEIQKLKDKVNGLQNKINNIQNDLYNKNSTGSDSNELSAQAQLTKVDEDMRKINGKLEELQYHLEELTKKQDALTNDFNQRIAGIQNDIDRLKSGQSNQAQQSSSSLASKPTELEANKNNFSTTSQVASNKNEQSSVAKEVDGGLSPASEYEAAFRLINQSKYDEAEVALKQFISKNPKNPLVENANYWLGETFYARNNYSQAAVYFMKGYQGYPKGNKAIDNLYKLGLSLDKMSKTKEACTTFAKIGNEFPDMSQEAKKKVDGERKRLACK